MLAGKLAPPKINAERADGQYQQFVAIKCVAGGDSVDALAQFRRERQILAEMRHPHIARLLDGGQLDDGRLWFAMELIDGARIDAHVRASVPSVAARIGLLRQVIDAVACAHQRLLLHRDIKPANVLIDADGSAKLLDFGIAALAGDQAAARAYAGLGQPGANQRRRNRTRLRSVPARSVAGCAAAVAGAACGPRALDRDADWTRRRAARHRHTRHGA